MVSSMCRYTESFMEEGVFVCFQFGFWKESSSKSFNFFGADFGVGRAGD